jgi:hypothetical protein
MRALGKDARRLSGGRLVALLLAVLATSPTAGASTQRARGLAAASAAAPAALASVRLSSDAPDADAVSPEVALDRQGDSFVVWDERTPAGLVTETASRRFGGGWTNPLPLASGGFSRLAVNARGDATVAGLALAGERGVFVVFRPAGRTWGRARLLARGEADSVSVAIDAAGRVTVGWTVYLPSNVEEVDVATRSLQGVWSRPKSFGSGVGIEVAMNARGVTLAVWHRPWDADGQAVAAWKAPAGAWQRPLTMPAPPGVLSVPGLLHAALDAHGDALVLWVAWAGAPNYYDLEASRAPFGRPFRAPQRLGSSPDGFQSALALSPGGRAVVVFAAGRDDGQISLAARTSAHRAFQLSQAASRLGGFRPAVAITPGGRALALWTQSDGFPNGRQLTLVAARGAPDGSFGGPVTLAAVGGDCFAHRCEPGGQGALAVGAGGRAALVWVEKPDANAAVGGVVFAASVQFGAR